MNTQITEDFVSFEIAKLLKEKGFDGECIAYYSSYKDNNTTLHRWRNRQSYVNVRNNGYTLVPTLQMAMKWLREVHHIHIKINVDSFDGRIPVYEALYDEIINIRTDNFIDYGNTYEEAVEAAIKYCLTNLI